MMNMYYKWKGKNALHGNWQTAMVVTFFSGALLTLLQVYQSRFMPVELRSVQGMYYWVAPAVDRGIWIGLGVLTLLAVLLTPALSLGCNLYFVRRVEGEELGAKGLLSRMRLLGKALWLYVLLFVKIFLWTCLLIVPGAVASIRYSMAPYLLAERPEMSAWEAIEESKRIMKGQKSRYFVLILSFVGWTLACNFLQIALLEFSYIVAVVAGLFFNCWISAYMNASTAAFYLTVSREDGESKAQAEWDRVVQGMRFPGSGWNDGDGSDDGDDLQ